MLRYRGEDRPLFDVGTALAKYVSVTHIMGPLYISALPSHPENQLRCWKFPFSQSVSPAGLYWFEAYLTWQLRGLLGSHAAQKAIFTFILDVLVHI